MRALLDADEYAACSIYYGLDQPPNFESHAWHLRVVVELPELAKRLNADPDLLSTRLDSARRKLFARSFAADLAGPRRENSDCLERADDSR